MEKNISTFVDDDLNEYCLLEIFSYLSINDMMQVKNVCRKWRQISQQWFKQVQTVEFKIQTHEIWEWKLYKNYFKRELGSGSDINKLIQILNLFGHYIKYFREDSFEWSKARFFDNRNLIRQLIATLSENVVDAYIHSNSYRLRDVDMMAKHWKKLEKFNFEFFCGSCEEKMCELLHNNQQLKIFSLGYDTKGPISDRFFTYLPTKIEAIDIKMSWNKKEKLTYFESTINNFTSLSSLQLSRLSILSDAAGEAIGHLRSLKHLALWSIDHYESRSTINPIANLENLKSLSLIYNIELDENNLINIVNSCKQLEQLEIFSEILTDEGMTAISKLKKLKILAIEGEFVSSNSIINLCDNLEVFICQIPKMNNNDAIKLLKKATNLWFVDFRFCVDLTEDLVNAANEIANERKRNILHMILGDGSIDIFDDVDTPYFKCTWEYHDSFSLNLLPNYITDYLERCNIYK